MKKRLLAITMSLLVAVLFVPSLSFASTDVAEVEGVKYQTVKEAIANANEGSTIKLISDVTEDVNLNKNVTLDGGGKYTISGATAISAGKLTSVILKPNSSNKSGTILSIGSGEKIDITMEKVTVNYSVTNRSGGSASTVSGNKANIVINNCNFINEPKDIGDGYDVKEWSYGLYINGQHDEGKITFINSTFNGAFRTMIPSASGNMVIENCNFINKVATVHDGPTSGAQKEATSLTTSKAENNKIVVKGSNFDNAGAIYMQTNITFENNTVAFDKYEHYIQASGRIKKAVDFSKNKFVLGENSLVSIDIPISPIIYPAGQEAVSYWTWADTPEDKRPDNYNDYKYKYNEDKTITFMPQSDIALDQFFNQNKGNFQVRNSDKVLIEKDLKIDNLNIPENTDITFEVAKNGSLTIAEDLAVNGNLKIDGNGGLNMPRGLNAKIGSKGRLAVGNDIDMTNNCDINNSGQVDIPDNVKGDGNITGDGTMQINHQAIRIAAVKATCDTAGNIEYWHCANCDKYYKDADLTVEIAKEDIVIKPLGHKGVKVEAKAPTKTEAGNSEYWYCPVCDKYFADEALLKEISKEDTVIAALGNVDTDTDADNGKVEADKEDEKDKNQTQTSDPVSVGFLLAALGASSTGLVALKRRK